MGHTPEPWFVREPDQEERLADIAEGRPPEDMELTEVYSRGGEQVCFVMNTTPNESDNAHLIAAAPELLAALKAHIPWRDEPVQGWGEWADAVAAIAKAEGRTNETTPD